MATATERGFNVTCIRCGNADATVTLNLDDCDTFRCTECEEEWSVEDVREHVIFWARVIKWVESANQLPSTDESES